MTRPSAYRRLTIEIPMFSNSADPAAGIKITLEGPPEQLGLPLDAPQPAARPADTAAEFARAWLAGELRIPIVPAPSGGLFEEYLERCRSLNVEPVDQKKFTRGMRAKGVTIRRGRYRADRRLRQAWLMFPVGVHRPPGEGVTDWLSRSVDSFMRARSPRNSGSGL